MPLNNPGGTNVQSGTYTGNGAANRAVPHNLINTPAIVLITPAGGGHNLQFRIFGSLGIIICIGINEFVVTIPDATNFYVGNAASYPNSANENLTVYHWVAIG
jgi:hypothetical protein